MKDPNINSKHCSGMEWYDLVWYCMVRYGKKVMVWVVCVMMWYGMVW